MSERAFKQAYETMLNSGDSFFEVSAQNQKIDPNYRPSAYEIKDLISRLSSEDDENIATSYVAKTDINEIIKGGNVVSSIQDTFATNSVQPQVDDGLRIVSTSRSDISKMKKLAKKLPDESRIKFETMIQELE